MKKKLSNIFHRTTHAIVLAVLFLSFSSFCFEPHDYFKGKVKTLVLDAGHGGKDPGTSGTSSREKDISLSIVLKIEELFKINYPGITLKLTRKTDNFIELNERAGLANRSKADLFVSVHCNANDNKSIAGSETYVMGLHKEDDNISLMMKENSSILMEDNHEEKYDGFDPNSTDSYIIFTMLQNAHLKQSLTLAHKIEKQFVAVTKRKSRGVRQAGFLVLWKTTMPSCLIEVGFLSNKEDEKFLMSAEGKSFIAKSIYRAIKEYNESGQ